MSRLVVAVLSLFTLCSAPAAAFAADTTAPAAARILVLASLQPLAMVAMAVATPDTEVKVLLPAGTDVHDYQLTPGQAEQITTADIVVWAGAEAEPYLAPLLAAPRAGQHVVDVSKLPGAILRDHRLDAADDKNRGRDPHLWLSTRNAALLATTLGAHLGNTADAEHFNNEMQRYRNRQVKRFAPIAAMPLLVAHDAYGYLFDEIGLFNATAVVIDPEIPASARRMADLLERVRAEKIHCMIGEPGFERGAAARLFAGIKANLVTIDPTLAGFAPVRDSYALTMTLLADTLYGCLATRSANKGTVAAP